MTTTVRRSDIVRARRQQRTTHVRSQRTGQTQSEFGRNMPPTVARGAGITQPRHPGRGQQQAKMRISLPLHAPGLELRLPALPHVRIGWRIISGSMAVMLVWAIFALWNSSTFQVNRVVVSNDQILDAGEIESALQVIGKPVFLADPQIIEENLKSAYPELANAHVGIGLPATIKVELTERQPLIYWKQDEVEAWVDADGVAFPARGSASGLVKVVASDIPGALPNRQGLERLMMPEMVKAILKLQEQVPEGQVIVYHERHGLGWTDPRGWKVYFGQNPDEMEIRLAVYKSIVELLNKRNITPAFVSVEYIHAPYYRLNGGD